MKHVLEYADPLNASLTEAQIFEAKDKNRNGCCPNSQGREVHIARSKLFSSS